MKKRDDAHAACKKVNRVYLIPKKQTYNQLSMYTANDNADGKAADTSSWCRAVVGLRVEL